MGNFHPAHAASAESSAPPSHDSNTPDTYPNPEDVSHGASPQSPGPPPLEVKLRKRERNTAAARRYRQKRQDRITELEQALAEVTKERDELRLRLARQEAQTATLRDLMGMSAGAANDSNPRG
ncbi:IDI4 [Magnaporthiopsis poae ATCC 64411]|uniref:IDI4 n=1 Tax=Magnaporthiopsis poae (strain ATCC 64411 / 73-15) TaxID=644358 RepID=A0A0C4EBN7_MAGP6|nr:IDI4 [Magnaporthiopsis poae ATCC 64411]